MHRCLTVREVVLEICRVLKTFQDDSDEYKPSKDLAGIARSCRALSDPALDVLWEELDYSFQLQHLLPVYGEDYRRPDEVYAIDHDITPEEWLRFDFYAHRVRRLNFRVTVEDYEYDTRRPRLSLTMYLSQLRRKPLLPFLRTLECTLDLGQPFEGHHLRPFLTPSLRQVLIKRWEWTCDRPVTWSDWSPGGSRHYADQRHTCLIMEDFICVLVRTAPLLESIHIPELRHLKSLHLQCSLYRPSIEIQTFEDLSTLDSLNKIRLDISGFKEGDFDGWIGFPALKEVLIYNGDPVIALKFLDVLSTSTLEVFYVGCDPHPEDAGGWRREECISICDKLASRWSGTLTAVRFALPIWGSSEGGDHALTNSLGAAQRLSTLMIEMSLSSLGESVDVIAQTWPRLQNLIIPCEDCTMPELASIALHCPNLRKLEVECIILTAVVAYSGTYRLCGPRRA
ncbi:hypothetical protein GLOTRDRAFT_92273 [Gloeophyllum trabeum ATCC 11539]|uniref:F-box domain-containing protein n=1 Tax=Gloeophyllum trabeum (strain ATCC 11539 / FP-39264 / Madison 617) TaxID=670483 RepID=S7QCR0_GLOTA|nr:uncharacterized protein GLOTRDRAFT_92273 [Gloeophyllum trabeum ATCC 11539]EPQ57137.1 hypothetical protein GLOTRDRAFT_92273 [Gloeophyllum trabeum ATCC 11539]